MALSFLGIGHSHLGALKLAYDHNAGVAGIPDGVWLNFHHITPKPFLPIPEETEGWPYLPDYIEAALERARAVAEPAIFLSLKGAQYFFASLTNYPRPYDFVLPERPDLDLRPDAQIVTASTMETIIRNTMTVCESYIKFLKTRQSGPIYHFSTPPPVADGDYLLKSGSVPQGLRVLAWRRRLFA